MHICTGGRIYPSLASCFVYCCNLQYHSYVGSCSATNCTPAPLPAAPAACGELGGATVNFLAVSEHKCCSKPKEAPREGDMGLLARVGCQVNRAI